MQENGVAVTKGYAEAANEARKRCEQNYKVLKQWKIIVYVDQLEVLTIHTDRRQSLDEKECAENYKKLKQRKIRVEMSRQMRLTI